MTHNHDNSVEVQSSPDVDSHDARSDSLHATLTAELALLDMLARLILDAAERFGISTTETVS